MTHIAAVAGTAVATRMVMDVWPTGLRCLEPKEKGHPDA